MMRRVTIVFLFVAFVATTTAFVPTSKLSSIARATQRRSSEGGDDGEVFISLEEEQPKTPDVTPLQEEEKGDDFKRIRVLLYMGISLLPILALAPFMASRDFIPVDPAAM